MTPKSIKTSLFPGNVEGEGVTQDTLALVLRLTYPKMRTHSRGNDTLLRNTTGRSGGLLFLKRWPCPPILITLPLGTNPRQRRGRGHRRPGGDGASIAQMYICAACRGNPLSPMPPAGGNLSATLPKGLKTCQLSLHTPKFKYAAKVTQRK